MAIYAGVAALCALLCALYLSNLSAMGLVSTDEPRYADIGRAMARSGDWITPRLWGHPWFEKPPLLYWLIAIGFKLGLGPELAPRLPVALMGLLFLPFFWVRLRTLWDARVASYSTAILATSAGWLALSRVAITDIPVAVCFSAAVLFSVGTQPVGPPRRLVPAAAFLGLATLAKSLLPLVFFLPILVLDYRRWREWLSPGPLLAFALVSLPWHVLCTLRNGTEFLRVLFVEHQFGRFVSTALQHVQPWWYFLPVIPLLLYPWFPLLVFVPRNLRDRRVGALAAVVLFGLVFLSASTNKLATYPLPLLPSACALIGCGMARRERSAALTGISVALLAILPPAATVVPAALAGGLRSATIPWMAFPVWLAAGLLAGLLLCKVFGKNGLYAAAIAAAFCFLVFQQTIFPAIDTQVSARPLWVTQHPNCIADLHRRLIYGLEYYAGRELPRCDILDQSAMRVVR